jgi:CubicO group peptidase (beta-lactamase class C family)
MMGREQPASTMLVGVLATGLACGGSTTPTEVEAPPYVYRVPEATDDGWPTAALADVGLDRGVFEAIVERTRRDEDLALHSVLLVRDGYLVLEEYLRGWNRSRKHEVQSVSKSFRSALVGIAIDQGLIEGVDVPFLSFFPEHATLRTPQKDQILLRHVLTMSSGLEWHESDIAFGSPGNDLSTMYDLSYPEWAPYLLSRPMAAPPGDVWVYNTGASLMLTDLITNVTGVRADSWADEVLYGPMRMQLHAGNWPPLADGLRPRDMAKLGELYRRGGEWDGVRVLPTTWVEESTRRHHRTPNSGWRAGYGYQWWSGREVIQGREVDAFAAWGGNGQGIGVFPELGLVVVVTAGDPTANAPFRLMLEEILPAVLATG